MHPNDVPLIAKLSDGNVCLSGGAAGADALWGDEAEKIGHQVVHWSFEGHKSYGNPAHTVQLDEDELKEADIRLEEANLSLKRRLPYGKPWIMNLLRRNWYQVQYAESLYAVGSLNDKAAINRDLQPIKHDPPIQNSPSRLGVDGGTAWACQMYLDLYYEEDKEMEGLIQRDLELYFYDQIIEQAYQYSPYLNTWIWLSTMALITPPQGIYAAIGSRDLLPSGEQFIKKLMAKAS